MDWIQVVKSMEETSEELQREAADMKNPAGVQVITVALVLHNLAFCLASGLTKGADK